MSSTPEASHSSCSLPSSSSKGTTVLQSTGHHRLVCLFWSFMQVESVMCSFVSGVYAFIKWVSVQLFKIMKEFYIVWYEIHQDILPGSSPG